MFAGNAADVFAECASAALTEAARNANKMLLNAWEALPIDDRLAACGGDDVAVEEVSASLEESSKTGSAPSPNVIYSVQIRILYQIASGPST